MTTRDCKLNRRTLLTAGASGAAMLAVPSSFAGDRPYGPAFQGRSTVYASDGMAATSQPLATAIALSLLRAGGSAVDAAIGANAALGLMEPTGAGIGGDLFALIWDPDTNKLHGLNASGPAPQSRSLAELKSAFPGQRVIPPVGTASITVPGAVDGWLKAHERFGKLPLKDVLAPAIHYARNGFPVSPIVAGDWALNLRLLGEYRSAIEEYDNTLATWSLDGRAPDAGERFANPALAATYEKIAAGGRAAFYEGDIAAAIDAYMTRIGGPITAADLAAYEAEWVEPISATYRNAEIFQAPPNSQGLTVLQMLRIMDGFDLGAMAEADRLHVMVEAKKLAFADRAQFIADPRYADVPVERLLSEKYVAGQRARIEMAKALPSVAEPIPDGDTIYLTVADSNGMMASWIQSNYRGMGSGLTPDGLGFMLQNRGAQFNLDPAHANAYAPGKRPFHTIIPGFATRDGAPWLSFGLMGGSMQPQGHAQILSNLLDKGMTLQAAGDAPRWHHKGGNDPDGDIPAPDELLVESGIDAELRASLSARGHDVKVSDANYGGYQAVMKTGSGWAGASEMRKDGMAAGY